MPTIATALFQPFSLSHMHLRNRIVMAPMTRNMSPGGIAGPDVAAYYTRRAKGGVGLIITEGTYIDHPGAGDYDAVPTFFGDEALAGWDRVRRKVQAAGAAIAPQLWHVGSARQAGGGPFPAAPTQGPLEIVKDGATVVEALSTDEIARIAASYARGAADAERLGFDAVEVHGAHGYLIDQFLYEGTNSRADGYGGSLRNRARLAVEIIAAMRAAVRPTFPIIFRFSQWKMFDYDARIAHSAEELAQLLGPISDAGVDIFHVSTRQFWAPAFEGSDRTLAGWTRRLTGKPVIAVGSVGLERPHESRIFRTTADLTVKTADLDLLIRIVEKEGLDLVAVGRAMLAEPNWAARIMENDFGSIRNFTPQALEKLR